MGVFGIGLVCFGGLWGATLGMGVYHIGVSWYCMMAQFSVNVYNGYMVQFGINLLAPTCEQEQHVDRFIVNNC